MRSRQEVLDYRKDLKRRRYELERHIDNMDISSSKALRLKNNYALQKHLIDWVLGEAEKSCLLLKEIGE